MLFLQRTVDGKNYWTFEYDLEAPGYGVSAFATVAVGNGTMSLPKQNIVMDIWFLSAVSI